MPTDSGKHITEGRLRLGIPGGMLNRNGTIRMERVSQEHHDTVQPKEAGRTPFNRQVRPLALRFHSQMRPTLFKGHFDGPAFDARLLRSQQRSALDWSRSRLWVPACPP